MRQLATDSLFGIQSAYGFRVSLKKLPESLRGDFAEIYTGSSSIFVFFACAPEWICNGEIDDAILNGIVFGLTHLS